MEGQQTLEQHELPFDPAQPSRGGWAVVELMGHRRYVGFVREVQLFGAPMCEIHVDAFVGQAIHVHGSSAIYGIHPCHKPEKPAEPPQLTAGADLDNEDDYSDGYQRIRADSTDDDDDDEPEDDTDEAGA